MDWKALVETMQQTRIGELPDRAFRLTALERVLDGTQYDDLVYPFSTETEENGKYIPMRKRRPSVRTNLCRVVVEDSVSLLFSEAHWPPIRAAADKTMKALTALVKQTALNEIMLEAATRGSVGSVAVALRVIKNRVFFEVMGTAHLTPTWKADDPNTPSDIVELYQTSGSQLSDAGYPIDDKDSNAKFWFRRKWDDAREVWYQPQKVGDKKLREIQWDSLEDKDRTVTHGLGFVPIKWIRNLPTTKRVNSYDGACTFEAAIDTVVEADYLLSQGGRGLKYASDPTLVIKEGSGFGEQSEAHVGGAANAIKVPSDGDAKLLEINGTAAAAVIEYVTHLRGVALEATHGNRANADRLSAATSGRSIELMMAGLIALADRLRISYGEGGLLDILRMVCEASRVIKGGLNINEEFQGVKDLDPKGLELRWPSWMPSMTRDILEMAQALVTAFLEGIISRETAVSRMSAILDVDDATEEFNRVLADVTEQRAEEDRVAKRDSDLQAKSGVTVAAAKAKQIKQKANAGAKMTQNLTA